MRPHSLRNSIQIAVIGGNGFLGRAIIARLSAYSNLRIFSLDCNEHNINIDTSKSKAIIQQIHTNVYSGNSIQAWLISNPVDVVIYTAGYENLPDGLWNTFNKDIEAMLGLYNTVNGMGHMDLTKEEHKPYLLYLSSWNVYGQPKLGDKCTEESVECPSNHAGKTKLLAEDLIKRLGTKYSLPWCIVRPTEIYGRQDRKELEVSTHWRGYVPYLTDLIVKKIPEIKLFDNSLVDLVHINYFTKIILHLIQNKIQGIYNISSGTQISVLDLANKISDIHGNSTTNITVNQVLEIDNMCVSPAKIQEVLPYDFEKYNLDSFLKAYISIRRYEIAENMAIEDMISEPLTLDTTATGAKEYYQRRRDRRKLSYSKIKEVAGDQFFNIKLGKLQDRTKELLELDEFDVNKAQEEQKKLEERKQLLLNEEESSENFLIKDKKEPIVTKIKKTKKSKKMKNEKL